MNKVVLLTTAISLFAILTPHKGFANTSINVRNSINGEDSTVKVESNDDSSSSINLNQTDNKTKIRLEQNGEVKTFETDGDENINWNSEDGTAKIEVNNSGSNKVSEKKNDQSTDPTPNTKKSSTKDDKAATESFSLSHVFDSIRSFFSSLFD